MSKNSRGIWLITMALVAICSNVLVAVSAGDVSECGLKTPDWNWTTMKALPVVHLLQQVITTFKL